MALAAGAAALANANLALNNAAANAQLTVLPSFSNNEKEDKYTATQWLEKVCLHKAGATWTDAQTITHFRNALRNKVVDWFDTLEYSGVVTTDNNWDAIKERFEIDYDAKPTPHTTISKLSQINQKPNESVNEYLNRALKILLDLKRSIDPLAAVIPQFVAPAGIDIEAWTDLPEATRNLIVNHIKTHAARRHGEQYEAIILTAGFKPEIKAKLMENETRNLLEIRTLAQRTEKLLNEKNGKTNGNGNGNTEPNVFEMDEEDVDAVRNGNRFQRGRGGNPRRFGQGGPYRGGFQQGRGNFNQSDTNNQQSSSTSTYTRGQPTRGFQTQRGTQRGGATQSQTKWCDIHEKQTHNTRDCFSNKDRQKKKQANEAAEPEEPAEQNQEEDFLQNDTIQGRTFFSDSKN